MRLGVCVWSRAAQALQKLLYLSQWNLSQQEVKVREEREVQWIPKTQADSFWSLLNLLKMDSILFNSTQKPLFCVFTICKVQLQLLHMKTNVVCFSLSPRTGGHLIIDRVCMCVCWSFSQVWLFCDPMDYSPPGSSVPGILQARILEWVAIPFSRDFPNPGIKCGSPTLQTDSLPPEPLG